MERAGRLRQLLSGASASWSRAASSRRIASRRVLHTAICRVGVTQLITDRAPKADRESSLDCVCGLATGGVRLVATRRGYQIGLSNWLVGCTVSSIATSLDHLAASAGGGCGNSSHLQSVRKIYTHHAPIAPRPARNRTSIAFNLIGCACNRER